MSATTVTNLPEVRPFDETRFVRFLAGKGSEDGRWELIEGIPIQMPPATLRHARIATNLDRLLRKALEGSASHLDTRREAGVRHPADPTFRPVADVVVIDPREELEDSEDRFYDSCALVAEVLSPSTEHYDLLWKRPRYLELPRCQHVLVISQHEQRLHLWSRATNFEEQVLENDDVMELPEFGFSCRVADLYIGTPVG